MQKAVTSTSKMRSCGLRTKFADRSMKWSRHGQDRVVPCQKESPLPPTMGNDFTCQAAGTLGIVWHVILLLAKLASDEWDRCGENFFSGDSGACRKEGSRVEAGCYHVTLPFVHTFTTDAALLALVEKSLRKHCLDPESQKPGRPRTRLRSRLIFNKDDLNVPSLGCAFGTTATSFSPSSSRFKAPRLFGSLLIYNRWLTPPSEDDTSSSNAG